MPLAAGLAVVAQGFGQGGQLFILGLAAAAGAGEVLDDRRERDPEQETHDGIDDPFRLGVGVVIVEESRVSHESERKKRDQQGVDVDEVLGQSAVAGQGRFLHATGVGAVGIRMAWQPPTANAASKSARIFLRTFMAVL